MSATAFLRQRRAVAARVVQQAYKRKPKKVAEILERTGLAPDDLGHLDKSNNVLSLADEVKAIEYDEPELDRLENLNVDNTGDRAAVHSPDVREDQIQPELQQPCQETVAVGNMHDGPQASEDLANVGGYVLGLPGVDGDLVKGAAVEAALRGDALARGTGGRATPERAGYDFADPKDVKRAIADGEKILAEERKNLPERIPSSDPAEDEELAPPEGEEENAGEGEPTDPDGTQEGRGDTPRDTEAEAEKAQEIDDEQTKFVKTGLKALDSMDRDALVGFASKANLDIGPVKDRDRPASIRKRIRDAVERNEGKPTNV